MTVVEKTELVNAPPQGYYGGYGGGGYYGGGGGGMGMAGGMMMGMAAGALMAAEISALDRPRVVVAPRGGIERRPEVVNNKTVVKNVNTGKNANHRPPPQ